MYANGLGVPLDYAEAAKWFRKAANQGDAPAANKLGWFYENGWGVSQDYAEALKWYRKAADQGSADAAFNIGAIYRLGHGVQRDPVQAYKWYSLAASRYPASLADARDRALQVRDLMAAKMTPEQIAEAQGLTSK